MGTFVKHKLNIKAESETIKEGVDDESSDESSSEISDDDSKKKKKGKDKVGFRDRKVRAILTWVSFAIYFLVLAVVLKSGKYIISFFLFLFTHIYF